MPRKVRVKYLGVIYQLMRPGDRRENVFLDDVDRQKFLTTLPETCQKTGFQVHAYCLMRDHFHRVVETPDANLVAGMAWFPSAYTIRGASGFGHVQERQPQTSPLHEGGPETRSRRRHQLRSEQEALDPPKTMV